VRTELTDLRVEHSGYHDPRAVIAKHRRNLRILKREVAAMRADKFTMENYRKAVAYERDLSRRRAVM
jgi:uncharacterized SAM-dependent methyltransferase